jgi:hypothetical protein
MICQWFGLKTTGTVSSSLASKPAATIFLWFGLKTSGDGFLQFGLKTSGNSFSKVGLKTGGWFLGSASKPRWWRVSRFWPQNGQLQFGDLSLKINVTVSWFRPQNHVGFGLSIVPQN